MLSEKQMYDKVYGCWLGKNIGGTLGGPIEGKTELMNHTFYVQEFNGTPMENDDLDLQLLNLHVVEQYGINITSRHIAEEWKSHVFFFMDEYALFLSNARRNVPTPISGHFNNEFTNCMGSPIRSEIWAVLAQGNPELAAYFAFQDASVDHAGGEGIYGEVFFAALESMAFYSNDLKSLTEKSLKFIPENCVTAKAVKDLLNYYESGIDWLTARQNLINSYGTTNFCYAPLNIAFTMLGLFYGKDFSDKLLKAVNCGYDTDCTAATAGSILGIMYGAENIPEKWIKPIGTSIVTCPQVNGFRIPKDIEELTARSIKMQKILSVCYENCIDKSVFNIEQDINTAVFGVPMDCICERDLKVSLSYEDNSPAIDRSGTKKLYIKIQNKMPINYSGEVKVRSLSGLKTGKSAKFVIKPEETFEYETFAETNGKFEPYYELQIVISRYISDILWCEYSIPFSLIPTYNFKISKSGDSEQKRIACPTHRIDFENHLGKAETGTVFKAETEMFLETERNLRFMVHTPFPVKFTLDGKTYINLTENDKSYPYLPAYHRPCPDAMRIVKAGKHKIEIEITKTDLAADFDVAFQVVDLQDIFISEKQKPFLNDDMLTQYNAD